MKVSKFKTLEEEREFWDTHDSTDYLDDFEVAKDVVFVRPKKEVISLRLEPKVIKKLRELADKEGLPPTTYARMLMIKGIRDRAASIRTHIKTILLTTSSIMGEPVVFSGELTHCTPLSWKGRALHPKTTSSGNCSRK